MYKTVRHGENSLQYTILPQTEEVLNNSGMKGKGRDFSPSVHERRSRKRSTIKYILLLLLGIVVALVVAAIPLYVMNGSLYSRRNLQDYRESITSAPLTPAAREIVKTRKKELKISPDIIATLKTKASTVSTVISTIASTTISEKPTTPPWTMPALRSWKSSTSSTTIPPLPTEDDEIPLIGTPSGSIRMLDKYINTWNKDTISKTTVAPETMTFKKVFDIYSGKSPSPTKVIEEELIATKPLTTVILPTTLLPAVTNQVKTTESSSFKDLKDAILSVDDDDEFKESLEVDEVFSLPPIKPESSLPGNDGDEITISKTTGSGWYGARWPFVDTTSYFQWTGYSPGDNLLLPLLVSALSSICLVMMLALAVRRKKRTLLSSSIGLTSDVQEDDNTNLLTADNQEEAEE